MKTRRLLLGNEAIARGLIENGCRVATSYPGTPASEILSAVAGFQIEENLVMHTQWAVNEKVAFEIAYAGCMTGLRTAVSMKQVGLNVASDPFMSSAYMGVKGGFLVISADDPGPHSSQTEQDSRMLAMMAKVPVMDPDSPRQAKEMTGVAFALSEKFKTPVMLRPTTRVCHSRQDVAIEPPPTVVGDPPKFDKDPSRWAATPTFRHKLHLELEEKLTAIAAYAPTAPLRLNPGASSDRAIVASGVAVAHCREILQELGLWQKIPLYQVLQPFPLHGAFIEHLLGSYAEVLVLEETTAIIEMQLCDRYHVKGRNSGAVPRVGELTPEKIQALIGEFIGIEVPGAGQEATSGRRPTLCAGCPHRASFFAIKKAVPRGIYTSDIGCYTLGMNLGAVDTVLCMGAAITQAAGFYHALKHEKKRPDIVATIGDSTFFHAGVPALMDAVVQGVKFTLVILDNRTTAMTGNQPTPASGFGACGEPLETVDLEALVRGCGVTFCRVADSYHLRELTALVKEAVKFSRQSGPAVVISRHPCVLDRSRKRAGGDFVAVEISDRCDGCGYCIKHFECPALIRHDEDPAHPRTSIDPMLCAGCGVCLDVCPKKAFRLKT